jgi:hypothetical protein
MDPTPLFVANLGGGCLTRTEYIGTDPNLQELRLTFYK